VTLAAVVVFLVIPASAQTTNLVRFFAMPYRVYEGDAVRFVYLDRTNGVPVPNVVPRQNILSWQWDFRSRGVVDDSSAVSTNIDSTWYAVYDPTVSTNGVDNYTPTLTITYTNPGAGTVGSITNIGITEPMFGAGAIVTSNFYVLQRGVGNQDVQLAVSANPRLGTNGQPIHFFVSTTLLNTNASVDQQNGITWYFDDGVTNNGSTVSHSYSTNGLYNVALNVTYRVGGAAPYTNTVYQTNIEFINIVPLVQELALGRAYRRGFPQTYDWNDIIQNYNANGFLNNQADNYIYYHHFETAFWNLQNQLATPGYGPPTTNDLQQMAEIVNEILQGQSLVGNQRLINSLRIKYPKLLNPNDATNSTVRFPPPPGARTETAAIEQALLDYYAALAYPFIAIQSQGTSVLRTRATPGLEPFPDFPLYLTILDPTLSQQPIPIKNEYWQLSTMLEKMALGKVEEAKKLFNLSASDPTARADSKAASKTAGMQGYLGMALLAAAQNPDDFAANQGNSLLADIENARTLFNEINVGVKPLEENTSFVPNESFTSIYQQAQGAVTTARQAEVDARQETRTYDQYQADLRNEQQSERESYITPLVELSGLDPALYNNLQTVNDQNDYRNTINQEVNALLAGYPNVSPQGLGQYGGQVISVLDAAQGIQQAINNLNNLYETIKIQTWANDQIQIVNQNATATFAAHDIARGYANAFSIQYGFTGPPSVGFNPGSIISGYLNASDRDVQVLQQAQIADINLESQIRQSLLNVANLAISIRRAKDAFDQENLKLDSMLAQMNRLIEDLANARDTAANLYFEDPSFRVVVSDAEYRADSEMDFAVDRLYRLAKTLQYEWTEGYQNPVQIPIYCQEPPSLENPLFDQFTQIDDLFIAKDADEAGDYLNALQAWDSKLRRINGTSVRGPNHAGPFTAVPISVREQILGFKITGPTAVPLAQSIQQFRAYLQLHRQTNYWNQLNPSLQFTFDTEIADDTFFPATGSEWNMRINSISVDLLADQGFSPQQVANVGLIESGLASLRTFWANPPYADQLFNLTFDVGNPNRTAFGIVVPADINGATGGLPPTEFINTGLADRPIAASSWILTIDTSDPRNASIDFTKLQDIIIRFTYTYGNPPEFPSF
jgi:hypothetical protein